MHVENSGVYECKAKGIRNRNIKPLVGDNVDIEVIDEENKTGNIIVIHERKNELIRPAAANIRSGTCYFCCFSYSEPNYNLLDKFLAMMNYQDVPVVLCFNKTDLTSVEKNA